MSEEKEIEGKTTTTGKQSSAGIVGRFLSVFDVMGEHSMKQIVLSLTLHFVFVVVGVSAYREQQFGRAICAKNK
jgi:hypothetical protein